MNLGKQLRKAMIDNNIYGAKQLADKVGLNYGVVLRLLNNEPSSKLKDAVAIARSLGLRITVALDGDNNETEH